MNRKIIITKCSECPNVCHKGAFGRVSYIPCCHLAHGRELPYTKSVREPLSGYRGNNYSTITATGTDEIPEWCPLEKNK